MTSTRASGVPAYKEQILMVFGILYLKKDDHDNPQSNLNSIFLFKSVAHQTDSCTECVGV